MLITISLLILAYLIMGKDIKPLCKHPVTHVLETRA